MDEIIANKLAQAIRERNEMADAIRQTLTENAHLADGDVCTFKNLKDVLGRFEFDVLRKDFEKVDHPAHYTSNGIEAIEVIEAFDLDFCEGNAIKYILRAGRKSEDKTEDLKKAVWYLNRKLRGNE